MGVKALKKKQVFIIAGVVFLIAAAAVVFLLSGGFKPGEQYTQAIDQALDEEGKALSIFSDFRMSVDPQDLSVREGLDKDWTHILILGTDTRNDLLNDGRSDAMLVASVNSKTKELKLTSLVRDMLVDIPGMQSQQRINTANAFGGPLLAIKTVNELLELNITRYCSINFASIISIVDLVGGVDVVLSKGEANIINVAHSNEPRTLNGLQALTYSRIRVLDNNFGRNERQRKVLAAMFDKVLSLGLQETLALLPEALRFVSTNLSTSEILGLMPVILGNTKGIDMLSLPPDKAYRYAQNKGESVITFDMDRTRAAFNDFIGEQVSKDDAESGK